MTRARLRTSAGDAGVNTNVVFPHALQPAHAPPPAHVPPPSSPEAPRRERARQTPPILARPSPSRRYPRGPSRQTARRLSRTCTAPPLPPSPGAVQERAGLKTSAASVVACLSPSTDAESTQQRVELGRRRRLQSAPRALVPRTPLRGAAPAPSPAGPRHRSTARPSRAPRSPSPRRPRHPPHPTPGPRPRPPTPTPPPPHPCPPEGTRRVRLVRGEGRGVST